MSCCTLVSVLSEMGAPVCICTMSRYNVAVVYVNANSYVFVVPFHRIVF